jgi:hypothetical protein
MATQVRYSRFGAKSLGGWDGRMKLTLVIATEGPWKGKGVVATPLPFVIGRDPQCHLRPASNVISQRHCIISLREGRFYFRDLGSTNGSLVNDRLVKSVEVPLAHGDRLTLGNLLFLVRIDKPATTGSKPPPLGKQGSNNGSVARSKPAPQGSLNAEEESVAEMLLSGADEEGKGGVLSEETIPEGTTEIRSPALPPEEETRKSGRPKGKGSKSDQGTTGAVAAELLKNYLRRLRDEADEL